MLEDPLTKGLVLIAIMAERQIVTSKESEQFKKFILTAHENAINRTVNIFCKTKSLFSLRCELRGRLGLPRSRASDPDSPTRRS